MKKGMFISVEGSDGSGKSTQIELLKEYLESKNIKVVITREPGGTPISEKIREIILDNGNREMTAMTEALLYAASRAQHVAQVIKPALAEGKTVICDRFIDSSIAYQGYGRGLGTCVRRINEYAIEGCMPDVTFLMQIEPDASSGRIANKAKDRLEQEAQQFHEAVYNGYLEMLKDQPDRIIGINARRGVEEIHADIKAHLDRLLSKE